MQCLRLYCCCKRDSMQCLRLYCCCKRDSMQCLRLYCCWKNSFLSLINYKCTCSYAAFCFIYFSKWPFILRKDHWLSPIWNLILSKCTCIFQHTTVLPFLLVEKYIAYHQYPSRKTGLATMLFFALLYLAW
jgi:hypothetical protein